MAEPVLITRQQWGAEQWQNRQPIVIPATHRVGWVVHWPGAYQHIQNHEISCFAAVRAIQRYHKYSRGWSDGAYSFILCPHGAVFELRGWSWDQFATSPETNGNHYTVCVLVDPDQEPTTVQYSVLEELIAAGRARGTGQMVRPHSSLQATSCPGENLRSWTAGLDGRPLVLGPATTPTPTTPPTPIDEEEDAVKGYIIYKDLRYANLWLVGGGGAVHLSPHMAKHYITDMALPVILDQHEQALKSMLSLSGIDHEDLVAG